MSKVTDKLSREWQDAANLVLGVWLIVSPWLLAYAVEQAPTANAVAVGAIITLAAAAALYAFQQWEEWINVALAAWLLVSPWVLGFGTQQIPTWNQIVVGILVGVMAVWSTTIEHGSKGLASKH